MNDEIVETVVIPKKEYQRLLERVDWLEWLEAAGVDNWEGYDYARELRRENKNQAQA